MHEHVLWQVQTELQVQILEKRPPPATATELHVQAAPIGFPSSRGTSS